MEFYFADSSRKNTDILPMNAYIDFDIGKENDFKVSIPFSLYDPETMMQGGYLYVPGTEIGGVLNKFSSDTKNKEVSFEGKTFRGMLEDRYTEPPSGSDYLSLSGELNATLRNNLTSLYGGLFAFSAANTGVSATKQISRFANYLEASNEFLGQANHKLNIEIVEEQMGDSVGFIVVLSARPIHDYSDEIENSQDGLVNFEIGKAEIYPYTHVFGLGSGELQARITGKWKINSDRKSLTEISSFPDGANVRIYKHDSNGCDSKDALAEEITKKLGELVGTDTQDITLDDGMIVSIGDIVGGRDYVTGTYIKQPVTQVVFTHKNGKSSYSYKIGDK